MLVQQQLRLGWDCCTHHIFRPAAASCCRTAAQPSPAVCRAYTFNSSSSSSSWMALPVLARPVSRALQMYCPHGALGGLTVLPCSLLLRAGAAITQKRCSCSIQVAAVDDGGRAAAAADNSQGRPAAAVPSNSNADNSSSGCGGSSSSSSRGSRSSSSSTKRPLSQAAAEGWVVNKEPISSAMSPQLYSYLLAHTREPGVLSELRSETARMHGGHMQVAPEQGQLLSLLVELLGVQSAIEVGVFTGYSSLAVALALPPGGRLVAFDRDASSMEVARTYWAKAGVADKVDARLGPALDGLQQLLQEHGANSFDFAFIDADKRAYQAYFELCLQLVRPGGLIAVDNVLFYGKVADQAAADKATLALKKFNDDLLADARVSFSIVPIGDGMALCRKR